MTQAPLASLAAPLARILLALMFLIAGLGKIAGYSGTAAYMAAYNVPAITLPAVIALEVLGGIALILGFQTRLVALALAGFTLVAAVIFHSNFADQMQMIMFLKNFAVAGGLLMVYAQGAGSYALDSRNAA